MASIQKRRYWVDKKTGKEVPANTPGAEQRESRFWRIRYRDAAGKPKSARGYVDLRATRQLAARLEAAAAQGEEGLINKFSVHDRRPLMEHVADYLKDLEMRGRDDGNLVIMNYRFKRLIEDCGWTRLRDVTAESFDQWRRERFVESGKSGKTLNHFFDTMRAFLNWCVSPSRNRLARNPLTGLERLPHKPTFLRRALQPEELVSLYKAAPVERYRVYVFAVTTGLRRQEIADLQWSDVVLDAPQPFLQLRDYATKARRADVFAIKSEVAAMLKEIRPGAWSAEDKVFAAVPQVSELLADLEAAGVALPDAESIDRIDFHALRTTLGSFIGRAGIPERTGMELMRVTDPKLLRRTYCDPRILQTAQAAAGLAIPTGRPTPPSSEPMILTGTDAYPLAPSDPGTREAGNRGNNRTQKPGAEGQSEAVIGRMSLTLDGGQALSVGGCSPPMASTGIDRQDGDKNGPGGARTHGGIADLPVNFRFPGAAGQLSDTHNAAFVPSPLTIPKQADRPPRRAPDRLLENLTEMWPSLSVAMRESLVAMAAAAAKETRS